jgi:PIN domain
MRLTIRRDLSRLVVDVAAVEVGPGPGGRDGERPGRGPAQVIGYFDTSAFAPLLVAEPASVFCRRLWDSSDAVVTSRLLYVETAAALAQALGLGRVARRHHGTALRLLYQMWAEFEVVEADSAVRRHQRRLTGST